MINKHTTCQRCGRLCEENKVHDVDRQYVFIFTVDVCPHCAAELEPVLEYIRHNVSQYMKG